MKIFISWSGELSKEFAKATRIWMETIFDEEIEYFMSDEDVQPGQRWLRELSNSLDDADLGLLCLTNENLFSQWIGFEAGWMAKRLGDGTVFPLLLDIDPEKVSGPLSEFQCKRADLKGMKDIGEAINKRLSKSLKETILERRVRGAMLDFSEQLHTIIQRAKNELQLEYMTFPNISDSEQLLSEALNLVRKARSSIEVLTPAHIFALDQPNGSLRINETYCHELIEHLTKHDNISFREVINPEFFSGIGESKDVDSPEYGERNVLDSQICREYFESLISLRRGRRNINLKETRNSIQEWLIIADRRYVLLERKLGVLTLNDPEGYVASKFSKEFALHWDSESRDLLL